MPNIEYQEMSHHDGSTSSALWQDLPQPELRKIQQHPLRSSQGTQSDPASAVLQAVDICVSLLQDLATQPYNPNDKLDHEDEYGKSGEKKMWESVFAGKSAEAFSRLEAEMQAAKASAGDAGSREALSTLHKSLITLRDRAEKWTCMSREVVDEATHALCDSLETAVKNTPVKLQFWHADSTQKDQTGSSYQDKALGHFTAKVRHLTTHNDYTGLSGATDEDQQLRGTAIIDDLHVEAGRLTRSLQTALMSAPADGESRACLEEQKSHINALPYWIDRSMFLRSLTTQGSQVQPPSQSRDLGSS